MGMKKNIQKAKELKSRILLVILENEDNADAFNSNFKSAVEREWDFNKSIEFISKDAFKELRKDKSKRSKYGFLAYNKKGKDGLYPPQSLTVGLLDKSIPIYSQFIDHDNNLTLGDLIFTVDKVNGYMNGFVEYKKMSMKEMKKKMEESSKTAEGLKSKTLLIDEKDLTANAKKEIETKYKHKFKIVSRSEIDKAIANKAKDIAYVRFLYTVDFSSKKKSSSSVNVAKDASLSVSITELNIIAINKSIYSAEDGSVMLNLNLPKGGVQIKMKADRPKVTKKDTKTLLAF